MTGGKWKRFIREHIEDLGFEIISFDQGSHYKVKVKLPGYEDIKTITCSISPSDKRGSLNFIKDLRHIYYDYTGELP